jgi:hypothetical protein
MDETRGHETLSKLTLPAGTEIQVKDAKVTLANDTAVRGESSQLDAIRNIARQQDSSRD